MRMVEFDSNWPAGVESGGLDEYIFIGCWML